MLGTWVPNRFSEPSEKTDCLEEVQGNNGEVSLPQENDPARSEQDVHDERRILSLTLLLPELLAQYFEELPYIWVM
jgi:hypothetical protein